MVGEQGTWDVRHVLRLSMHRLKVLGLELGDALGPNIFLRLLGYHPVTGAIQLVSQTERHFIRFQINGVELSKYVN